MRSAWRGYRTGSPDVQGTTAGYPTALSAATSASAMPANVAGLANERREARRDCGETNVGHFLFAKNEALIGRGVVRLRHTSSGHSGCRCTTHKGKTHSGGPQCHHGAGACLTRGMVASSVRSCENA